MTRRRFLAVAVVGLLALVPATPAAAEVEPTRQGWWWRHQTGTLFTLPSPPGVPEGGLYVANDPSGPEAVSALIYRVAEEDEDETMATLELVVAEGFEGPAEGARIYACPIAEVWAAGSGEAERWGDRPQADCEEAMVLGGIVGDDEDPDAPGQPEQQAQQDEEEGLERVRMSWELTEEFKGGRTWNFMLTPHPDPDPEEPEDFAPFRVAFEDPAEGSFEVGDPFDFGDFDTDPGDVPAFDADDDDPAPAFAPAPVDGPSAPAPAAPTQPDAPSEPPTQAPTAQEPPFDAEQAAAPAPETLGAATMLAAAVLLALLAAVWWLSQQQRRVPKLLGPLAHRQQTQPVAEVEPPSEPRGVGRFRRPRTEPPRRIY